MQPDIGLGVRVFANGPGDLGSIPGRVIPKTQKMVLDASLLNTQHYKVRIKGKVEQSREGVAPSPTHWCSSYRKGSLRVTLDYGRQLFTFFYLYLARFLLMVYSFTEDLKTSMLCVMVIVKGDEIGDQSSNPGWSCLGISLSRERHETGFFNHGQTTSLGEEKFWIQTNWSWSGVTSCFWFGKYIKQEVLCKIGNIVTLPGHWPNE